MKFDRTYAEKGKYSFAEMQKAEKEVFEKKIKQYEKLNWQEFRAHGGAKCKIYHEGRNLPRRNLSSLSQDIKDSPIWRFRINRTIRVLGYEYEIGDIFFMVWIDRAHRL